MNATNTTGELVLAPRNRTLFSCKHTHVLHMPYARRPFKLLTVDRMRSYDLRAMLLHVVKTQLVWTCPCVKAWAMLRCLRPAGKAETNV